MPPPPPKPQTPEPEENTEEPQDNNPEEDEQDNDNMSKTEVKTEDKGKGRDDDFDPWATIQALLHEAHLTQEPYQWEVDEAWKAYGNRQSGAEYRQSWHSRREMALHDLKEAAAKPPDETKKTPQ